jgi:predicted MFS family arabinose efflux permease
MESRSLKQISVLMATVFVDMIGFTIVLPLLPFYATRLGADATMVGALISAFPFAQFAVAPLWGRLSDRIGRRPLILAGLLASAAAYVLFGLAESLWLLFASRLVQGAGGGTTGVVQAYVADAVVPEERTKALGWLTAATSAGVMIGPAIGSVSTYLGPEAPGFLAAGLCLLNALFAWKWLPESKRDGATAEVQTAPAPRRSLRSSVLEVLRHPAGPISSLIWVYTIGMMGFMAMNGVLALYLNKVFGVTEQTIGYFYAYVGSISLVMRGLLLGPAVRRFGEVGVTRLGALSLSIGLIVIPLPTRLLGFALCVLFVPIGTALLFPATTSLVSRRARRSETGQVMGVQQFFGGVSRMLGPFWAGLVFQKIGMQYPFWIAAALMLSVSFLTLRMENEVLPAASVGEAKAS